jgi:isoleucyl-tRNA synthetase
MAEAYRKIRNTMKFILGNLYDFDYERDHIPFDRRYEIDRWAASKAHTVLKKVTELYETFEFYKIYRNVYNFCITELSSFYLDILKDRLYTFGKRSLGRRSAQSSLHEVLILLEKLIAPILVFTAEEAWQNTTLSDKAPSVHLSLWPELDERVIDEALLTRWDRLIQIRNYVLKAIEDKRMEGLIGGSLEAKVALAVKGKDVYSLLHTYRGELPAIFIVSEINVERVDSFPDGYQEVPERDDIGIAITKASGTKCPRCWNYSGTVGNDTEHPQLCERCIAAINES